jgi:hypothetical protein
VEWGQIFILDKWALKLHELMHRDGGLGKSCCGLRVEKGKVHVAGYELRVTGHAG